MNDRKPYQNPDVESAVSRLRDKLRLAFADLRAYIFEEASKFNRDGAILKRDSFNLARIRELVQTIKAEARSLGFGDVIESQADELLTMANVVLDEAGGHGLPKKFTQTTGENLKSLLFGAEREILANETKVARDLERILLRSATGNVKIDDLLGNLQSTLEINERQAITKAADTVSSFHTQARREHYEDAGVEWFLYDGPRDVRNRPFCAEFVGTRVTAEILNKHATDFGRKHPLPPSISLGGWECRHELIPLVDAKSRRKYPIGPRSAPGSESSEQPKQKTKR